MVTMTDTDSPAYANGVARAEQALAQATAPPAIDRDWCRFGRGITCANGDECTNPRHRKS
jgi:hypothetical protein